MNKDSNSVNEYKVMNDLIGDVSFKENETEGKIYKGQQQLLTGYVIDPNKELSEENKNTYLKTLSKI